MFLWELVYIVAFKELLECFHSKVVSELIEQSIRHVKFEAFRTRILNVLYAVGNFHIFLFLEQIHIVLQSHLKIGFNQ